MNVGQKIRLKRRWSELNDWSIRPDLDGKVVEITEIEDRPNGSIQAKYGDERLLFFRDAVGEIIYD